MIMRYIPHTSKDVEEMLKTIKITSIGDLFKSIPAPQRLKKPLNLPNTLSEMELRSHVEAFANRNTAQHTVSFLGAGCYNHFIPTIVNYLASQGGFLTAYTPYQPEISQGTLQATFEFQTMIARLTGMDVANACMYDGATSLAEACLMAKRLKPKKRKILMAQTLHPEYREVSQTYLEAQDVECVPVSYDRKTGTIDLKHLKQKADSECLAILVQHPTFFGTLENLAEIKAIASKNDALFIVAVTEPLSLALLKNPGHFGADIVVGEAQSFGNPPSYGGPHVGFFATQTQYVRNIPGRIVGETVDHDGKRCYCLTLSTREQHIRRERATSNICTNEALLATRSTIYLSTVGNQGLRQLAKWNHSLANQLADRLADRLAENLKSRATLKFKAPFFNELVIECRKPVQQVQNNLLKQNIIAGLALEKYYPELKNCLLLCTTEINTPEQIQKLCEAL